MGKIISMKTRQRLGGQDYTENEALLAKEGHYLGALPMKEAEGMRKLQDSLICEKAQINELIEEFDEHYRQYLSNLTDALLFLGYNPIDFNPDTDHLYIGEDGNVWVVNDTHSEGRKK